HHWSRKKRDSSCKISNETLAGIEIIFKEKDIKYLEFLFVYYMDDPIRKVRDRELFDRLSLRKRRNNINLNSGPLFEILVKHWISYLTAIGALVFAASMLFAGWFHYHKAAPKLA
ncbi:protein ycf2, partial [Phtheirospermum japonicum]